MTLPFVMPEANSSVLLIEAIRKIGLAANLQICLDARDKDSFTSGQKWLDRSGNGHDFFLGADGSAAGTDPTFFGTAGMPNGFFSFDGGDFFTYDTTNEAWMQNLHKAGGAWTVAGWLYWVPQSGNSGIVGDTATGSGVTGGTGINVTLASGNASLNARVRSNGNVTMVSSQLIGFTSSAWHFFAASVNSALGAAGGHFRINHTTSTFDATYSSPSSGNATSTMQIMSIGAGTSGVMVNSGTALANIGVWNRGLTANELLLLFNETRQPFGV